MGKVQIVTDSSAHFLSPDVIERYDIKVVPLTIRMGSQLYRDGIDIDSETFFRIASRGGPTASVIAPSTEEFAALYNQLNRQTDQILSLHVSRKINPTWDHARAATKTLLGRCEIAVLDSMTTSVGLALLVQAAAKAAEEGANLEEVVRLVRGMLGRIYLVLYVENLDYLRHSGLLSEAQSILGTMLNIKPFLTIEEGELLPMEKVRTQAQAIDKLVEFVTEFSSFESLVILQNTPYSTDQTRALQERLAVEVPGRQIPAVMYGPSLAALIGLDGLGIVVHEGEDNEEDF